MPHRADAAKSGVRAPDKPPTMRDVAARAQVDTSVVSRLLNNDPRLSISAATRERVLAAVDELDYRPNIAARTLRTSRGGLVSFMVPELTNQVYAAIISGAHRRAIEQGYSIVIGEACGDLVNTGRDYRARGIDGVLLAGAMLDNNQILGLAESGVPLVVVNRSMPGMETVQLDYGAGCTLAAQHLIDLGHERIVILSGPTGFDASTGRAAAFSAAARRLGNVRTRTVAAKGITAEGATAAGHRLLDKYPDTTATFTTTLMLAVGLLRAAHERSVRVPEQLSIVSMHDSQIAEYAWPPLTTVAMPMTELGAHAFNRLVALINRNTSNHEPDVTVDVPPRLMVRGTTAPPLG